MKRTYLILLLTAFASCLYAQDLKTPEFFIDQIPPYPATPEVYKQKLDTLQLIDQGIEDAKTAYQQAQDDAVSKLDPNVVAQAYMASISSTADVKGIQQQAQQSIADADTTKGGYATIMNNFNKKFKAAQAGYDAEMKTTVHPLDSALLAMVGEQNEAGAEKMKQLALKRKAAYSIIMGKYLLGGKSIFEKLLEDYKSYMFSTSIPKFDRQERDQTKILNLPFIPHTAALKELQTYLWQYQKVLENFKDYKGE